ncbi:MAG: tyrosine-type recombinase/integrase [Lachnospiraceae bacterium]|nr:tyrosine-type recombinase/integrase [Lachnospiraceae bacterium]
MSTTHPIKSEEKLKKFKEYYLFIKPVCRNYAMIILGLNTAFRIGDLLSLQWRDVFSEKKNCFKDHICITEQKTGKERSVAVNDSVSDALYILREKENHGEKSQYLFPNGRKHSDHLSRSQAFRIIKEAAEYAGLEEHISCHSLRKTFGYHAWKQGVQPALLMELYNHSSYRITKQYLCIEQDDKDMVYLTVQL